MAAIGKVTAFITRLGANGPELCVFDHPSAGVQLPAGTLGPDEDVCDGALREAFEETGLDDLQIRCEVAVLPAAQPGTGIINRPSEVGGRTIPPGYLARVLAQDSSQAHVEVDGVQGLIQLDALSFDASDTWSTSFLKLQHPMGGTSRLRTEEVTAGGATGSTLRTP
jgi:8-oxo-dGTP pyrophosphatase MutT (NUDIX family)